VRVRPAREGVNGVESGELGEVYGRERANGIVPGRPAREDVAGVLGTREAREDVAGVLGTREARGDVAGVDGSCASVGGGPVASKVHLKRP